MSRQNQLLTSKEILKELGIKSNDRKWVEIKSILKARYGMVYLPGAGNCIIRKNFEIFLHQELGKLTPEQEKELQIT